MIGMKIRYELNKVNLKISNGTLPDAEDSCVLLTAADENKNEIVFTLSHEQAEHLENELNEINLRRKEQSASSALNETYISEPVSEDHEDHTDRFSH